MIPRLVQDVGGVEGGDRMAVQVRQRGRIHTQHKTSMQDCLPRRRLQLPRRRLQARKPSGVVDGVGCGDQWSQGQRHTDGRRLETGPQAGMRHAPVDDAEARAHAKVNAVRDVGNAVSLEHAVHAVRRMHDKLAEDQLRRVRGRVAGGVLELRVAVAAGGRGDGCEGDSVAGAREVEHCW